jgi:hypothetical protein
LALTSRHKIASENINYHFNNIYKGNSELNPFLSLGVALPINIPFVSLKPGYIKSIDLKLGGGARWRFYDRLSLNTAFYYFPMNKFYSVRLGLDFVFN